MPRSSGAFRDRRDERRRRLGRQLRFEDRARLRDGAFGERHFAFGRHQMQAVFRQEIQRRLDLRHRRRGGRRRGRRRRIDRGRTRRGPAQQAAQSRHHATANTTAAIAMTTIAAHCRGVSDFSLMRTFGAALSVQGIRGT